MSCACICECPMFINYASLKGLTNPLNHTVMSKMLPTFRIPNTGKETTRLREVPTKTSTKTTPTDLIYNSDFNIHKNISIQ